MYDYDKNITSFFLIKSSKKRPGRTSIFSTENQLKMKNMFVKVGFKIPEKESLKLLAAEMKKKPKQLENWFKNNITKLPK